MDSIFTKLCYIVFTPRYLLYKNFTVMSCASCIFIVYVQRNNGTCPKTVYYYSKLGKYCVYYS